MEEYRAIARQKECTDSYNKYFRNIINTIKEKETAQIFNIRRENNKMNRKKYLLVETATTNTQKYIDITVKEVLDQKKRNSSDGDTGEENITQT